MCESATPYLHRVVSWLLPLNPWIETRKPLTPINILPCNLHLPDLLRTAVLCYLVDDSRCSRASGRFAELPTFPFFSTAAFPPKNEYVGAVG